MNVPLADLRLQHERIGAELDEAVREVVSTSRFVGGPVLEAFAAEWAKCCGARHAVPCSNGTEALRIALLALLGDGDGTQEVITVSHTFAATVEAICTAGYKPVLVDADPRTYLMDLDQAEAAIGPRTTAIVPVHLYGQMADMRQLKAMAERHGVALIEDAAQAHGAAFAGLRPGQVSDAASFSFFPGKNLGAWGDAGAVVCNNDALAERIAALVDHGRSDKFTHTRIGWNARMDSLQAAVLRVKLRHLEVWNERRREVADLYRQTFAAAPQILLPEVQRGARHVYHQFVIQVEERDRVRNDLQQAGIATGIHYPIPVHEQPAYRHLVPDPRALPDTHEFCKRILSLPIFPEMTDEQAHTVADALCEVCSGESVAAA